MAMSDVIIRFMTEDDIPTCRLITLANWEKDSRVARHILYELRNPDISYLVAITDGKVVGFAGWSWSNINYDIAEFVWCNVSKDYQGQGVGRKLTQARLNMIRAMEGKLVMLTTTVPEVYEHYGFKTIGVYDLWASKETSMMVLQL